MIIGVDARHLAGKKRGIGYYIKNLIEGMLKVNEDIEFILFLHKKPSESIDNPRLKICELKMPFYSRLLSPLWFNFYLPMHLKKYNFDILYCPNFFTPLFFKSKLVIVVHDLAPFHFPEVFPKLYPPYFKFFLTKSIQKADAVITPTRSIKEEVENYFPQVKEKVFYIYHGVDELFRPLKKKEGKENPYILYVGALMKRKNIIGILKSFYILKKDYKVPHYLVLIGKKGPGWKDIYKEIKSHFYKDFIIHKGYVEREEIVKIYQNADVFLFPSFYEGFGFPVLEAMRCGIPVVISNDKALVEVTKGNAVIVNPLNYKEIANKIYSILTQKKLKENLIKKGLEVSSQYTWQKAAFEVYRVCKSILL